MTVRKRATRDPEPGASVHHKPTSLVYQALTSRLHDNQLVRTYQLVNLLVNLAGKMQPDLPAQYYIYVFVTAFL